MQQWAYEDPNEPHVVNYVPDEISVLVAATGIDVAALDAFYGHVRARLNEQIVELLAATPDKPDSPLEADFEPTVLRERFRGVLEVLQPLQRPQERTSKSDAGDTYGASILNPVVSFNRGSGRASHHMYFQLGGESIRPDHVDLERLRQALQSVRELALLLNRFALSSRKEPFGDRAWSITAVAPNWMTVAHQIICGSPAGLPVPVELRDPTLPFLFYDALDEALQYPARGEVIVAVLDTCPSQASVDGAAARYPDNTLLNAVQHEIRMDTPSLVPTAAFGPHLAGCMPRLQWDMRSGPVHDHPEQFVMADHGLFVAGVVRQILDGKHQVYLIRVLNDFGIGDLFAISHALAALPRVLLGSDEPRPGGPRLVVNLSLGIDYPIPARLLDRWFPAVSSNIDTVRDRLPDIAESLKLIHANLSDIVDSLTERGVLIVAAAGNDALREDVVHSAPPPPRLPARYDDVLGVASTRSQWQTASNYSNRGELTAAAWPGDVATLGGNINAAGGNQPGTTDPNDGVVGIFSADTLPGGAPNRSGGVRWAGTSFSAPIVAAVAARLWAANPGMRAPDVIALVHSLAQHPHGGANPDSPLEVPVLQVSQPG